MEQNPSYDWDELGTESFYHKFNLYKLSWPEIDLAEVIFAAAPYGGALALTRDDEKFQKYRGQSQSKSTVQIYSCVGELLHEIRWTEVSIRALGWSEEEKLLIVTKEGIVRHYDLLGNFSQFSLLKTNSVETIVACRFWARGLVAQTSSNDFIKVDNYFEPRPQAMQNTNITSDSQVHSWTITAPPFSVSRQTECLVAIQSTLLSLDGTDSQDLSLEQGPFTHVETSPNGQFLALRCQNGKILVTTSDFQRTLTEYDAGDDFAPSSLVWCGNDAVAATEGSIVTLIGPSGETLRYAYDSAIALVPEVDGLRLFSSTDSDFLRKVPDTSERIFAPGSTSAASILLDALDQLEAKSAKADENVRLIMPYLTEAVDDCVRAAAESLSSHWQKQLLKAASFGKGFLDLYNSDEFVDTCESLRVMNAVRFHDVGIPLTYEQYMRITPELLIERLLQRKHHYLAAQICDYLRIPTDHVHVHWACLKLQTSEDDAVTTCDAIVRKLSSRRQISYEKIARTAYADGRVDLATQLLEHEPRAGAQVHLILDMDQQDRALSQAIASGNPDLLSHVIFYIKNKSSLATFLRTINGKPEAIAIVLDYARKNDLQLLKDYYYQDDKKLEGSDIVLEESLDDSDRAQQYTKTKSAARMVSENKENALEARILDDAAKLMQLQDALAKEYGSSFNGLSLADILLKLLSLGNVTKAQKIGNSFKMTELTFTWLQLRSFITQRDWSSLEKWVYRMKKPVIPYEIIATHVHDAGNKKLAAQIVTKCATPALRIETYMKLEEPALAGQEAYKIKDLSMLREADALATDGTDRREIGDMIRRLQEAA